MKKLMALLPLALLFTACAEDPKPKPQGFFAMEYPVAEYELFEEPCPFMFEKNEMAEVVDAKGSHPCWINLEYKPLNGTIFITYQPVENNLDSLLRDAQKLPLQHTIKADAIEGDIYTNQFHKTYGMFYEVEGDAASQAQFYLTDSVQHFLTGSIYFNVKPNFDSILPAASYLKKDMIHLMETVRWKKY